MLNTPANITWDILALLLVHHSEDGDQQFPGELGGVDILLLKAYTDIQRLQLSDRLQTLLSVSGKPWGGLDEDSVDPSPSAVRQEPLEIFSFLGNRLDNFLRKSFIME